MNGCASLAPTLKSSMRLDSVLRNSESSIGLPRSASAPGNRRVIQLPAYQSMLTASSYLAVSMLDQDRRLPGHPFSLLPTFRRAKHALMKHAMVFMYTCMLCSSWCANLPAHTPDLTVPVRYWSACCREPCHVPRRCRPGRCAHTPASTRAWQCTSPTRSLPFGSMTLQNCSPQRWRSRQVTTKHICITCCISISTSTSASTSNAGYLVPPPS